MLKDMSTSTISVALLLTGSCGNFELRQLNLAQSEELWSATVRMGTDAGRSSVESGYRATPLVAVTECVRALLTIPAEK